MSNKALIWIVGILVVAIIAIIYFQQRAKQKAIEAKAQASAQEAQLAMQYMQYVSNQNAIYAQESASVGDWLSTIQSIGGAVSSIFSGFGSPTSGAVSGAQSAMSTGQIT